MFQRNSLLLFPSLEDGLYTEQRARALKISCEYQTGSKESFNGTLANENISILKCLEELMMNEAAQQDDPSSPFTSPNFSLTVLQDLVIIVRRVVGHTLIMILICIMWQGNETWRPLNGVAPLANREGSVLWVYPAEDFQYANQNRFGRLRGQGPPGPHRIMGLSPMS